MTDPVALAIDLGDLAGLMAWMHTNTQAWGFDDNSKEGLGCEVWWRPYWNGPRRTAGRGTVLDALRAACKSIRDMTEPPPAYAAKDDYRELALDRRTRGSR